MSNDWIEHNGGPQPVADDVVVEIVWPNPEGRYLSFGDEIEAASEIPWEGNKPRYRILNQHLIDAKQAEIDALRDDLETWQSVFPHVMPERLKSDQQLAEEDVAAKIDAKQAEVDQLKAKIVALEEEVRFLDEACGWNRKFGKLVQSGMPGVHLSRLEGIRLGLEAAHKAICALPVTPESDPERVQDDCADSIAYDLMINIETIAREAQDMGSDTSAGTTA